MFDSPIFLILLSYYYYFLTKALGNAISRHAILCSIAMKSINVTGEITIKARQLYSYLLNKIKMSKEKAPIKVFRSL